MWCPVETDPWPAEGTGSLFLEASSSVCMKHFDIADL